MKPLAALLLALVSRQLCPAAYNYYQTYTGTGGQFTQNGTLTNLSTPYGAGLTSSDANGGSLISSMAVPDGTLNYEAAMTLGIAHSGVTYTLYLLASSNAQLGASLANGTYYAVDITPTLTNGSCSANLSVTERNH